MDAKGNGSGFRQSLQLKSCSEPSLCSFPREALLTYISPRVELVYNSELSELEGWLSR